MTEPLYLDNPMSTEFTATVEGVHDDGVVFDRTLFYPTGGGQPHDTGTVHVDDASWTVTDVHGRDAIYHVLDGEPPSPDATVEGIVDWPRRWAHSRYHTAQHLLSAILLEEFDAPTRGNQLRATRARLDCEYDRFELSDLESIEKRMNDLVEMDLPVRWYELDRKRAESDLDTDRTRIDLLPDSVTEVRIVEIGDRSDPFDRTACAGTHVERTGQIGRVIVTGRETGGSGRERVRFELAEPGE